MSVMWFSTSAVYSVKVFMPRGDAGYDRVRDAGYLLVVTPWINARLAQWHFCIIFDTICCIYTKDIVHGKILMGDCMLTTLIHMITYAHACTLSLLSLIHI